MDYLLLIKSLHIITAILWIGSLYVLLQSMVAHNKMGQTRAVGMFEMQLYRTVVNPMMMATFILGIGMLVLNTKYLKNPWMHVKLTVLILMLVVHLLTKKKMLAIHKGGPVTATSVLWLILGVLALLSMIVLLAVHKDPIPWILVGGLPALILIIGGIILQRRS